MASLANDLKEIREFDKALKEKGHQPPFRSTKLNAEFDNWVFTLNREGDKIVAMRFDSPGWIEV